MPGVAPEGPVVTQILHRLKLAHCMRAPTTPYGPRLGQERPAARRPPHRAAREQRRHLRLEESSRSPALADFGHRVGNRKRYRNGPTVAFLRKKKVFTQTIGGRDRYVTYPKLESSFTASEHTAAHTLALAKEVLQPDRHREDHRASPWRMEWSRSNAIGSTLITPHRRLANDNAE